MGLVALHVWALPRLSYHPLQPHTFTHHTYAGWVYVRPCPHTQTNTRVRPPKQVGNHEKATLCSQTAQSNHSGAPQTPMQPLLPTEPVCMCAHTCNCQPIGLYWQICEHKVLTLLFIFCQPQAPAHLTGFIKQNYFHASSEVLHLLPGKPWCVGMKFRLKYHSIAFSSITLIHDEFIMVGNANRNRMGGWIGESVDVYLVHLWLPWFGWLVTNRLRLVLSPLMNHHQKFKHMCCLKINSAQVCVIIYYYWSKVSCKISSSCWDIPNEGGGDKEIRCSECHGSHSTFDWWLLPLSALMLWSFDKVCLYAQRKLQLHMARMLLRQRCDMQNTKLSHAFEINMQI